MKVVVVLIALAAVPLLHSNASAAPLGKYSDDVLSAPPVIQPQLTPRQVKQRLNEKMEQAIRVLNAMDDNERRRWIQHYEAKYREASANKNYLEAAYYRGILDAVQ